MSPGSSVAHLLKISAQGDQLHIGIGHAFEDAGDVLLIAGEPVHRLREDQVETSARGIGDQGLDAGTEKRGA
jgi:hypothetical protein